MSTTKSIEAYNKLKLSYANKYERKIIRTYEYWGKITKIIDADTFDMEVDIGFDTKAFRRFRLIGVDAPEIFGVKKTSDEYKNGIKAKKYVESRLLVNNWYEVIVYAGRRERFGRWLCEIFIDGVNFNRELIELGYDAKV